MLTDIEINQQHQKTPIKEIAEELWLQEQNYELYGNDKAKISLSKLYEWQHQVCDEHKQGKLILVTAITPTSAGEGKTTVSIGLADGLRKIWKKAVLALREPSLWPCFGVKGGACGGGYAQITPMEDINLHFTGDIHAITSANNLIAAVIDNHIYQGNALGIDPKTISWTRCLDMNDRALREGFCISAASEMMAIVCLSKTLEELKNKIDNITIGENFEKKAIKFWMLNCTWAVVTLLKDAIKPNLVQTLEKTPAFVHGGPFANIAHGCNSINATISALATWDYVVTEAGFGADLGAEKFFDIKCQLNGLKPDACVIVATVRALKMHGGIEKEHLGEENVEALEKGFENLRVHLENSKKFWMHPLVAINKFSTDTSTEIEKLQTLCDEMGVKAILTECREKGGNGALDLAREVCESIEKKESDFSPLYSLDLPLSQKIETIAKEIYHAKKVVFSEIAKEKLALFTQLWYENLPVCIAKTQNSISHDKKLLGAPKDYSFPIRDLKLYSGARFIVALAGSIVTMPGLPKVPAAMKISIDEKGVISGLE